MTKFPLIALVSLSLLACKQDEEIAADATATANARPATTNEERLKMLPPPPPECGLLTKEEIQEIIPVDVVFPMPGQRSVGSHYSCKMDVDGNQWSGQVVTEYPREPRRRQSILDEVAGATAAERVTINGHAARITGDVRVIAVAGPQPYRVKFAAFPRKSTAPVWTPEESRTFLIAFAEKAAE